MKNANSVEWMLVFEYVRQLLKGSEPNVFRNLRGVQVIGSRSEL